MSGSSRSWSRSGRRSAALIFTVYMKTDWGISLFFLTPLALVAIPALRLPKVMALSRITAIRPVITLFALVASPDIAALRDGRKSQPRSGHGARAELARELTQAWQTRFHSRWAVVAGATEVGEPMTFYSPDHPAPFTPGEIWSSGLTSLEEAKRLGLHRHLRYDRRTGCRPARRGWRRTLPMPSVSPSPRSVSSTAIPGPAISWKVYIVPRAK